jgi:hypothetical protein
MTKNSRLSKLTQMTSNLFQKLSNAKNRQRNASKSGGFEESSDPRSLLTTLTSPSITGRFLPFSGTMAQEKPQLYPC